MWPFTKTPKQIQIQTVLIDPLKLRLSQWQGDRNLAGSAAKVLQEPTCKLMLQVMSNESPALWSLDVNIPMESRALHQARIEGYNMALKNMEELGKYVAFAEPLEATFQTEEQPG